MNCVNNQINFVFSIVSHRKMRYKFSPCKLQLQLAQTQLPPGQDDAGQQ